ncbi:MAG: hypothetical protein R3C45_04050 [Phycisphaerales bacterium]
MRLATASSTGVPLVASAVGRPISLALGQLEEVRAHQRFAA